MKPPESPSLLFPLGGAVLLGAGKAITLLLPSLFYRDGFRLGPGMIVGDIMGLFMYCLVPMAWGCYLGGGLGKAYFRWKLGDIEAAKLICLRTAALPFAISLGWECFRFFLYFRINFMPINMVPLALQRLVSNVVLQASFLMLVLPRLLLRNEAETVQVHDNLRI